MDAGSLQVSIANHIEYTLGKDEHSVTPRDFFWAVARAARDRMMDRWHKTQQGFVERRAKRVYYLSMEYLLGRLLRDGLSNLGILEPTRRALATLGQDLDAILDEEVDPGLGNGGLGRLAACFLDSMATLGIAGTGYGIRYEYGIFRQEIVGGAQVEHPDNWLAFGSPWEIARPDHVHTVQFGGRVETRRDEQGRLVFRWVDTQDVLAMAHDIPVPGYRNEHVNTLRLWAAKATREFDFADFNRGDYVEAVRAKNHSEDISRVLYPNDQVMQGKELRLKQEFFFVSASLQDALAKHLRHHDSLDSLPDQVVFQLNDTHPAIAVAELMRLLLDVHGTGWERAWEITRGCFAYTNHTLLPEALERWPVWLLERVLPRHMQIIAELDQRVLAEVRARFPGDTERLRRVALVDEFGEKQVRMANLAIVGSHAVNGVSELHSRLLRERMFPDFDAIYPGRFRNKTNGVTPRRWLLDCNPGLARLLDEHCGTAWPRRLDDLRRLEPLADDAAFRARFREVKRANKERLAATIARLTGVTVSTDAIFDAQVKRFHEYKRQLLLLLHTVALYQELKDGQRGDAPPRVVIFAGKAAPGYERAKQIIQLVGGVADVVNRDTDIGDRLKVVFLPNYSVSLAEVIIPGADLSEQISTAGMEASGTGNMKFAMNGALTIGTLDGANIEIRDAVGEENMFVFGMTAEEVLALKAGGYRPREVLEREPELRRVVEAIASGAFARGQASRDLPIVSSLLDRDEFCLFADFGAYRQAQRRVEDLYRAPEAWSRAAVLNVARMGRFSSDHTIADYARDIWGVPVAP
jgi:starch phosphorylase